LLVSKFDIYLSKYGEEDMTMRIHEKDFITTLGAIVINAIYNLTFGVENCAPFASED